jgi:hypothetical protein
LLVSFERTKAVFVIGAAAIFLGVIAIWWYVKRPGSS